MPHGSKGRVDAAGVHDAVDAAGRVRREAPEDAEGRQQHGRIVQPVLRHLQRGADGADGKNVGAIVPRGERRLD